MRPLGILVALPDEGRTLTRGKPGFDTLQRLPEGHWLAVCGTGPLRAERLALKLVEQGVGGLLSWGCAAALNPGLKPGQLLLPERIFDENGERHHIHPEWHRVVFESLRPHHAITTGPLAESSILLATSDQKTQLRERTQADAADMESAALARVAGARNLSLLVIRSVSDDAKAHLPKPVLDALDDQGAVHLARLLRSLMRGPSAISDLVRLGFGFQKAMSTLKSTRKRLDPDFHFKSAGQPASPR